MASTTFSLRSLFAGLSLSPLCRSTGTAGTAMKSSSSAFATTAMPTGAAAAAARGLHTTAARTARAAGAAGATKKNKKKKKKGGVAPDARIINLKLSMPRRVPAPLRFARNRYLRHWTIHRAWLLFQRRERERREREMQRMYGSMHNAMEELRTSSGPATRPEGYLYRKALEKMGLYGHHGIPIEYARAQTETPPREPWNHDWTPS